LGEVVSEEGEGGGCFGFLVEMRGGLGEVDVRRSVGMMVCGQRRLRVRDTMPVPAPIIDIRAEWRIRRLLDGPSSMMVRRGVGLKRRVLSGCTSGESVLRREESQELRPTPLSQTFWEEKRWRRSRHRAEM
jgi:hypothetical protein